MIRLIEGQIRHRDVETVIVGCGGVGYHLRAPLPLVDRLGEVGQAVTLWVHTQVREDAINLFGFETREDLKLFETLIGINKIGAKLALAMMSTLTTDRLVAAVRNEDIASLTAVPGIGKRSAERLVVELRDRLDGYGGGGVSASPVAASGVGNDLQSGLMNLGFRSKEVSGVVEALLKERPDADLGELLSEGIARLSSGAR